MTRSRKRLLSIITITTVFFILMLRLPAEDIEQTVYYPQPDRGCNSCHEMEFTK